MFLSKARHRVVFRSVQHVQDAGGKTALAFDDAGTRWAKVMFLSRGSEFVDEQWQSKRRIRLHIRHDMEVALDMQIGFKNRYWRVREVRPFGEQMEFLEIIAEEE